MIWSAGILEGGAGRGEAGCVRRVQVAGVRQVFLLRLGVGLDRHRLVVHVVGAEIVGQVELGGRARLDADRRAVEFGRGLHAHVLANHEALAVIVVDAQEREFEIDVPAQRPGRIPVQEVDFAGRERREARLAGRRRELDRVRVAEHGRRRRAAEDDVEPVPVAVGIRERETGEAGGNAALDEALGLHVIQRRAVGPDGERRGRGSGDQCRFESHGSLISRSSALHIWFGIVLFRRPVKLPPTTERHLHPHVINRRAGRQPVSRGPSSGRLLRRRRIRGTPARLPPRG